jgi:hypothetical protein
MFFMKFLCDFSVKFLCSKHALIGDFCLAVEAIYVIYCSQLPLKGDRIIADILTKALFGRALSGSGSML